MAFVLSEGKQIHILCIFKLQEEKAALLTLADLRDSLPDVACELASYEAAWRGASGSTAAALGIKIAQEMDIRAHIPQVSGYH